MLKKLCLILTFLCLFDVDCAWAVNPMTLCTNATANGSCGRSEYPFGHGTAQVVGEGTWNGATVQLTFATTSGATLQSISGATLSSTSPSIQIDASYGEYLGATISSAGGSTNLTVKVLEVVK